LHPSWVGRYNRRRRHAHAVVSGGESELGEVARPDGAEMAEPTLKPVTAEPVVDLESDF
jgi:hypothetical protein